MNTQETSEITLQNLYDAHSGKISDKWFSYLVSYDEIFREFRHRKIRILEIGVQNGGSLELWARYFPNAKSIVGCDIDPSCKELQFEDERISVVVGDISSEQTEEQIFEVAEDFDIIIDDGSHESGDIIKAFARYFERLTPGGVFVVEDLHCSYWGDDFNGGLNAPFSSISFFKRIIDVLNYEHWGGEIQPREILDYFSTVYDIAFSDKELLSIESVVFQNSLCVVHKAESAPVQLGVRVVAGETADVTSDPVTANGSTLVAPIQSSNVWGPSLGSLEQLVASVYERSAYEEQQKKLLEEYRQLIEPLDQQYHSVIRCADELESLIKTSNRTFRHPIRSSLTSKASRWAAALPGLSDRRRERFLRFAEERDGSALLDGLMKALDDISNLSMSSDT